MTTAEGPVEPVPSTLKDPAGAAGTSGTPKAPKPCNYGPRWWSRPLKSGCQGDDVRVVQHKMGCTVTGLFDQNTKDALNRWLYAKALPQNGVVDVKIAKAMGESAVGGWWVRVLRLTPVPLEGPDVVHVQERLGVAVTGRYDLETSKRVRGFQKTYALPQTGDIDQATAERLVVLLWSDQ